jgi:dipeptidyl aminopeptidase/acylaminoacyl peptidase
MRLPSATAAALCLALGVSAAAQTPLAAPNKRPMTFADLMAMKRISDPQISPSGKWVMFSVTDVSLEKNTKVNHLWVVPLAGGPERQVTSNTGESFGRFSPNGQFVSYTASPTKDDPVARITIATWDEAAGTIGVGRTLQAVSGDADGAIWSPDSKHFLFTTQVYPECSNKATWVEEDACDKAKEDAADKNAVKAQIWDHLLYRHWNAFTGEKRTHILEADFSLDGANPRDLTPASVVGDAETPTFSLGGPLGYAWAPDSKEIAYVTNLDAVPAASTNNDVFTLRLDEPGAKAVKVSTSPGSDDGPAYSPDGKWLAFRSQARAGYESDRFRLMLFDREKKTTRELMPKFDRWVDEFVWAADSKEFYFASGASGHEPIFSVAIDGSDLNERTYLDRSLEWGEFGELNLRGNLLVSTRMTVTKPAEVFVMQLGVDSGANVDDFGYAIPGYKAPAPGTIESATPSMFKLEQLSHLNDGVLSAIAMTGITDSQGVQALDGFTFSGADATKVEGFVIRPPGFDPAKKYPLKFLIHGGPQGAWGDSWSYRWNAELMAASGYVVVMVNPRGSTGYGQKFVEGVSGDWGGKAYTDLMRGLDAAEAKYPFIDKTRECALGASYGGYMADWVLTHTNRFKCIVTHDGMYDAEAAYGSTEEMWFNEWEFRRSPATGAAAWDPQPAQPWRYSSLPADQDPFRKFSPMRYIQNAKTPTLVIHSQKDYRLDVSQGFELFTALQRRGVPSKFLYFPDEGHWVLKPKNSELWYQTVGEWCDRWTKGTE